VAHEEQVTPRPLPLATLAIGLVAGLVYCWPAATGPLIYQRSLLLHGEVWRAWTGHLVHFGSSHLIWDLVIFLAAGCWLERIRPGAARWFYVLCPPVIAVVLLVFDPTLERYAGLSGVATGVLVFLGGYQLRHSRTEPKWFWIAALALVAFKIALESVTRTPLLVQGFVGIRVVPLAHLSGAGCGLVAWALTRRE
jgi:rhomboid family GlyGly-CTERM serine protease